VICEYLLQEVNKDRLSRCRVRSHFTVDFVHPVDPELVNFPYRRVEKVTTAPSFSRVKRGSAE
jgi:hypothetical protein